MHACFVCSTFNAQKKVICFYLLLCSGLTQFARPVREEWGYFVSKCAERNSM